jgi:hypothetical protein
MFRILRLADMKIRGMDELYFYVHQTYRLLKQALENVVKRWEDPRLPMLELESLELSKADREWLKGSYFFV